MHRNRVAPFVGNGGLDIPHFGATPRLPFSKFVWCCLFMYIFLHHLSLPRRQTSALALARAL